jgi:hypothetical protein
MGLFAANFCILRRDEYKSSGSEHAAKAFVFANWLAISAL